MAAVRRPTATRNTDLTSSPQPPTQTATMTNKCHNTLLARLSAGFEAPTYSSVTLSPYPTNGNPTNPNTLPTSIRSSLFRASSSLSNLTLYNCIFNNVLLRHCIVVNGILHNCILIDCKIRNSVVKKCQVVNKPLALRRFPAEIREIIFEYASSAQIGQEGKIPNLVKALLGDQVLYHEAIEAMYKMAFVPLTFMPGMKPAKIHMVTKVSIDCDFPTLTSNSRILLEHCKAVREIHIPWLKGQQELSLSTCRNAYAALWVERFGTVKRISIVYRRISSDWVTNVRSQTVLDQYNVRMNEFSRMVGADYVTTTNHKPCYAVRVLQVKNGNALKKVATRGHGSTGIFDAALQQGCFCGWCGSN
ncbi:hypothetical protein N431DRAFT_460208 [Stipitochalara longipes BDJ]|nr:hypothetical protein N431DRAFT_460208 [Stipitochalara longipes BDJ]